MPWGMVENVLIVDYAISATEKSDLFHFALGPFGEEGPAQVRFWFAPGLGVVKGEGRDASGVFTGGFEASSYRSITGVPTALPRSQMITSLRASPNPFNPATTISFDLTARSTVTLHVYDTSGRLVKTLLAGAKAHVGSNQVHWDGRDEQGQRVASGMYLYRLEAGEYSETKRMALIK